MKKIAIVLILTLIFGVSYLVSGVYIPNNRDTQRAPEEIIPLELNTKGYTDIKEYDNLVYRYKHETDVIAITDKSSGYTWKSGIDYTTNSQNDDNFDDAVSQYEKGNITLAELKEYAEVPDLTSMTTTRVEMGNSIITLEYFSKTASTIKSSSISSTNSKLDQTKRTFEKDSLDDTHYVYTIDFDTIGIKIRVDFYFREDGMSYEIREENIEVTSTNYINNIIVMPYFGAQGGVIQPYKLVENDVNGTIIYTREKNGDVEELEMLDGYSFIPDGSGALVRFNQNTQDFDPIHLPVYGVNQTTSMNYYSSEESYETNQYASMPVYGMAVGNNQSAFVSFATKGDNYMTISAYPDGSENGVQFNRTYARFNYDNEFYQVQNQAGDSYASLQSNRYSYDIYNTIQFLSGTDANYLGMAESYRSYLMENDLLFDTKVDSTDIPLHLDFLMADSQSSVFGTENVVMTTSDDVSDILNDIKTLGITNINASLLGFENGGVTLRAVNKIDFTGSIGSKNDFKKLITNFDNQDIDISFILDYYEINEKVISSNSNASKHLNGWYNLYKAKSNALVKDIYYLRPDKAYKYAKDDIADLVKDTKSNSITISGITNNKLSHFNNEVDDDMMYYENILKLSSDVADVNAVTPNSYLWKYVTRYLNADPFNSQFLAETDTVPFISYLLQPVMEVYADYANFGFYNQQSILRMIDYNMNPSFVLTKESSHLLIDTNSSNYFSTEYSLYKDSIDNIYSQVNEALKDTYNATWINREVLYNGVIVNTYDNGVKIVINYTDSSVNYNGRVVAPTSSEVFK